MRRNRKYRFIAILSVISLTGGVVISGFTGFQIYSAKKEEARAYLPANSREWKSAQSATSNQSTNVASGSFLGTLSIPSLKKSIKIYQGTTDKELAKGAGHYLQSVMPGISDNSVISGHRDTVFSSLGKVKIGAYIVIKLSNGTYTYKVNRIRIVDKNDRTVIVPTQNATLTLSTCYPFIYIGSAPKRYIVVANMVLQAPDVLPLNPTLINFKNIIET